MDKIKEILLWGFPAKYVGKPKLLKAYQKGKEDVVKEINKHYIPISELQEEKKKAIKEFVEKLVVGRENREAGKIIGFMKGYLNE